MKRIRIGNDINIEWSVKRYGQPENFYGRNLILKMVDPNNREHTMEFTTEGNVIRTAFLGMNQELCGSYSLVLVENSMEVGMTTIDKTVAFILVPHSYMESGVDPDGITTTSDNVNIETEITLPADGLSAYEIAVKNGYEGSEQEWLQSLVGAPGVDGSDADVTKENIEKALGYVPDSGVGQMMIAEDETVTGKKTFVGQIGIENTDLDKNGGVILRSEPFGVVNKTDQLFIIGTKGSANIKVERDPVDDLELATRRFVIKEAEKRQAKLTAGYGVTIDPSNKISVSLDLSVFKVVTELPEYPASGDENKIHLIPASKSAEQNIYTEYVYVNGVWEKLGEYNPAGGGLSEMILSTTYSNLVSLRDSNRLIPGMQYRITDYDFTTTEADTDSAHMPFDIIVTADSESVLNESARAIHHQYEEGEDTLTGAIKLYKTDMEYYADEVDTGDYFLLAGKVEVDGVTYYRYDKYEADANTGRYILLESIDLDALNVGLDNPLYPVGEGTYEEGVPYISHFEDAIVDYENGTLSTDALSQRNIASWKLKYTLENTKHSSTDGKGTVLWMKDEFRNECNYDFINALFKVYKITSCPKSPSLVGTYAINMDNSAITYGTDNKLVSTFGSGNHDNIIKYDGLAKIVLGNNCSYNTFGNNCSKNTFGNSCFNNAFGNSCFNNAFGNNCSNNTFGNGCESNTFGDSCSSDAFGNDCSYNAFGNNCHNNTFGNNCSNNAFGYTCSYNTFGNSCSYNTFGNGCSYNTFGNYYYRNTFGNSCQFNHFGNGCQFNLFGNGFSSNTLGNYCAYIKLEFRISGTVACDFYENNHFGDGCMYILFPEREDASPYSPVQNYNFAQGLQGTSSSYLTIDGLRELAYETKVAKNSAGELKIYCEADLIQ